MNIVESKSKLNKQTCLIIKFRLWFQYFCLFSSMFVYFVDFFPVCLFITSCSFIIMVKIMYHIHWNWKHCLQFCNKANGWCPFGWCSLLIKYGEKLLHMYIFNFNVLIWRIIFTRIINEHDVINKQSGKKVRKINEHTRK